MDPLRLTELTFYDENNMFIGYSYLTTTCNDLSLLFHLLTEE